MARRGLSQVLPVLCCFFVLLNVMPRSNARVLAGGNITATGGGGDMTTYMIGGTNAFAKQYPFYVQVYFKGTSITCGGSLVAPDIVLSAAHCFVPKVQGTIDGGYLKPSDYSVLVGAVRRDAPRVGDAQSRKVLQFKVHPNYRDTNDVNIIGEYDAVLMKIEKVTKSHLKHVALNFDPNVPPPEGPVRAIGMGRTVGSDPTSLSQVLQYADSNALSNTECQISYGCNPYLILCARDLNGFDAASCFGDSGGPLLDYSIPTNPVQVGIMSFVTNDVCNPTYMNGYARVSSLQNWLKYQICKISSVPEQISFCPKNASTSTMCKKKGSQCNLMNPGCCKKLTCRKTKKKSIPRCGTCTKKAKVCGKGKPPCCPPLKCLQRQTLTGAFVKKCSLAAK